MLIYGAIIIPVLISVYLLTFHRKDVKWWEFLVMYGVALMCIVGSKYSSESAQVYDTEFWGHLSHGIIHEEPYSYEDT